MTTIQDLYGDQHLPTFTRISSNSQLSSLSSVATQAIQQSEMKYLENYPHYFPTFSREDAMFHLKNTKKGTFLIRPSSQAGSLVISLTQSAKILHLLVIRRGNGWGVDPAAWKTHELCNETFPHVEQLMTRLKQFNMLETGLTHQDVARNLSAAATPSLTRMMSQNAQSMATEAEYKGMLSVFLAEGHVKLQASQVHMLQQWRQKHGFTQQQHAKVLASLGLTEHEFDSLIEDGQESTVGDSQLCVVCADQPRQAAFVPCGHVATCCECAQNLKVPVCPLCRTQITRVLKVFIA